MSSIIPSVIAILFVVGIIYFIDLIATRKDKHLADIVKFRYILCYVLGLTSGFGIKINAKEDEPIRWGFSFVLSFIIGTLFGYVLFNFQAKLDKKTEKKIKIGIKRKVKGKKKNPTKKKILWRNDDQK